MPGLLLDPKIHSSKCTTSRSFKRARDQLNHINRSYTFLFTTCTTIEDVDLDWDDFTKFYKLLYYILTILEHDITKFLDLLHFLDSWVVYKKEKKNPWWGQNALH
jgi:hypothetical protein